MKKFWTIATLVFVLTIFGCKRKLEISGTVYGEQDGNPLFGALITDCKSGQSVSTDKDGNFSITVEEGDSVKISMVGLISKTIPVNSTDSIIWKVTLKDYGPIIEPVLQRSYGTYDGVFLTVKNNIEAGNLVDSIILSVRNETDETVMFGEKYELETKRNGRWQPMPYNREYEEGECIQIFSMVGYRYSPHSENDNINYTQPHSNQFKKGLYRIMKTFFVDDSHRNDTVYVEFEVQ